MELAEVRRYLHQHPELSGKEHRTIRYIEQQLEKLGFEQCIKVGETGLLYSVKGTKDGPVTLFRADIDALPIEDDIEQPYRSKYPGIGHKCGHDGHTTIMLGFCEAVKANPPTRGEVLILFQPAEETGEGAQAVIKDLILKNIKFDYAFALHNIPGEQKNKILLKEGAFASSVISCTIKFKGESTHAAEPWKAGWVAPFLEKVLQNCNTKNQLAKEGKSTDIITLIHCNIGEKAYGTTASEGRIDLTLRSETRKGMEQLRNDFTQFVEDTAKDCYLKTKWNWLEEFEAVENHAEAFKIVEKSAKNARLDTGYVASAYKWGEDFGYFCRMGKCCMFGLGAGQNHPELHSHKYDFPDEIIPSGISLFDEIKKHIHDE